MYAHFSASTSRSGVYYGNIKLQDAMTMKLGDYIVPETSQLNCEPKWRETLYVNSYLGFPAVNLKRRDAVMMHGRACIGCVR